MFRLTFEDGTHIDADADHEWIVHSRESRKRSKKPSQRRTTAQLFDQVDVPNGRGPDGAPRRIPNWTIDLTAPIDVPDAELPIDPYLFGLWLGDGDTGGSGFTSNDGLEDAFRKGGFGVSTREDPIRFGILGLHKILRTNGLLGNKHVPQIYFESSASQRLALLQGLLDSDGTINSKGQVEFINTNRSLADAVLFLARSLGIKARIKEKRATLYGKDCGPCWRVTWCSPLQAFRLARKAAKIRTDWIQKSSSHRRIAIESIVQLPGKFDCQCIRVDHPSHMYLAGPSLIPTSNCGKTTVCAALALWFFCSFPDARVFVTAVKATQIQDVIWYEIKKLIRKSKIKICEPNEVNEKASSGIRAKDGRMIWGTTSRTGEGLAGISGANILVIADEASGISDNFFTVLGTSLAGSGGTVRKCYISNPTRTSGEFYRSHTTESASFNCIHISSEDTPNARRARRPDGSLWIIPGLAGPEYIEERKLAWGEDSYTYRVRIKGEFVSDKDGKILSMDLIEHAKSIYDDVPEDGPLQIGLDPAGDGVRGDEIAIAVRRGLKVITVLAWRGISEDATVLHTIQTMRKYKRAGEKPRIALDCGGGIGTRILGMLLAHLRTCPDEFDIVEVRSNYTTWGDPDFDTVRDKLWGNVADFLKDGGALPSDEKLDEDLNFPIFSLNAKNKYVASSKEKFRKELKRSPDRADAVCLAVWEYKAVEWDNPTPAMQKRLANEIPDARLPEYEAPPQFLDPYAGISIWQR
jgi:hypothetical protein